MGHFPGKTKGRTEQREFRQRRIAGTHSVRSGLLKYAITHLKLM